MKIKTFLSLLCITIMLVSCGGTKKATTSTRKTPYSKKSEVRREVVTVEKKEEIVKKPLANNSYADKVQNYIFEYAGIAKQEMSKYGIPASITLAQGILESGAGYGELTSRAKNHFGIKCHDWTGDRVYHDDDRSQECFRKYDEASQSFRDHSLFLKNRKRYAKLFTYKQHDYKSWAKGLKAAGYATDPKYPAKLIGIIERYGLAKFDKDVLRGNKNVVTVETHKKQPVRRTVDPAISGTAKPPVSSEEYIVKKGDTLYSISRRYQIKLDDLKAYNDLTNNTISVGQVLRLTPEEHELDEF